MFAIDIRARGDSPIVVVVVSANAIGGCGVPGGGGPGIISILFGGCPPLDFDDAAAAAAAAAIIVDILCDCANLATCV